MPTDVILPKVDMDMTHGRISTWLVAQGDRVTKDQPLFEIETDKAAMEVEAPVSGVIHHLRAVSDDPIAIGEAVAWIYAEGEAVGDAPGGTGLEADGAPPRSSPDPDHHSASASVSSSLADEVESQPGKNTRATPRARALARDHGLDLASITGSGPRGRIQAGDVLTAFDQARMPSNPLPTPVIQSDLPNEPGPLAVHRRGSKTGAPFVFIHGMGGDALAWAALEALLPKDRQVLKIELPNHGRSPKRPIRSFVDLVREVRATFDALDLRDAHVVGHSLGGAVALAIADTRADRLSALTLIAPAGLGPDINGAAIAGLLAAARKESLAMWLKELVGDSNLITDQFAQVAITQRQDPLLRSVQLRMADALFEGDTQMFDLRSALDRLSVPTRLIWGRDDRIVPWRQCLIAPGRVSLNLFAQIGHLPHIECPAEIAKLCSVSAPVSEL